MPGNPEKKEGAAADRPAARKCLAGIVEHTNQCSRIGLRGAYDVATLYYAHHACTLGKRDQDRTKHISAERSETSTRDAGGSRASLPFSPGAASPYAVLSAVRGVAVPGR